MPCCRARNGGYSAPPPAPPPDPGTWGDHPPMGRAIDVAIMVAREGGDVAPRIAALESEPGDGLAAALARLGRAVTRPKS
jgi:hypothetical protein